MKYAKYVHVLDLVNSIPNGLGVDDASAMWDRIYHYIHEHFPAPESYAMSGSSGKPTEIMVEEAKRCYEILLLSKEVLEEKLEKIPPEICEIVFPVAVARYLLRDLKMQFDHKFSTTFREFYNRYCFMILSPIL